jgi:hypothetical protein
MSEEDLDFEIFEILKNKHIIIGSPNFIGEITEFRFRKEKLLLSQIKDE